MRSPFRKLALAPQDPPPDAFVVQLKNAPSKDQGRVGISLTDGTTTREVLCAPAACAAGSAFFARMFDKTWNGEHNQDPTCRQVPDLDPGESVLRYLGGEPLTLDDNNLVAVANMADYWDIAALQDDCRAYLAQHLTKDNLCHLFSTSCEVGEATEPLTRHICDIATALDIQTDETPSSPAAALALASYASAPNEPLTIARFKRLTDNPPAYDVHVRRFEPNVLPNISQGKSSSSSVCSCLPVCSCCQGRPMRPSSSSPSPLGHSRSWLVWKPTRYRMTRWPLKPQRTALLLHRGYYTTSWDANCRKAAWMGNITSRPRVRVHPCRQKA